MAIVSPVDTWSTITAEEMAKETKKIEEFYKSSSAYSFYITHSTFKNYTTTVAEDKIKGYYVKDAKNNYHSFIMGTHTIQNAKIKMTIDSLNKMIQVSKPDLSFVKDVKLNEIEEMLALCTSIKKQKGEETKKFKMEFEKKYTYSAYEIWVDNESRLEKLVMYFNAEFPSDPNDEKSAKTKPRGEIIFSNYKTGIKPIYKDHFDESKYITLKGDKYVAAEKYKDYKIYDLRVKTK